MNFYKSGNPTLSEKIFQKVGISDQESSMTIKGTLFKFGFMFILLMASATYSWRAFSHGQSIYGLMIGGVIAGLILALIIIFKPTTSPYLAPAYALAEGLFLGAISSVLNEQFQEKFPNLVLSAVGLTFGVVIAMIGLYSFRIIRPTQKLKSIIILATVGIGVFYLLSMLLGLFGITMPLINSNSNLGIIFSLVVVVIAALNLILDFERIEEFSKNRAPKFMEWYSAFSLMITIVWLYIEILRLLSKLASRRD